MGGSGWAAPAAGYLVFTGIVGVTAKLALRHMEWPQMLVWATIAYMAVAALVVATGHGGLQLGESATFALATGLCAALGLVCAFLALRHAEVSVVVPVMSAYPIVTVLLSALVLSEPVTASKGVGVALVIGGIILLSR